MGIHYSIISISRRLLLGLLCVHVCACERKRDTDTDTDTERARARARSSAYVTRGLLYIPRMRTYADVCSSKAYSTIHPYEYIRMPPRTSSHFYFTFVPVRIFFLKKHKC